MTFSTFTARILTFVAGNQVTSAFLNALQDALIDLSTNLDVLGAEATVARTATANTADSPAPDTGGGVAVWVEKSTNGTNVVVLDNSADWRDRIISLQVALLTAANALPGGANDLYTQYSIADSPNNFAVAVFYSEAGQTGAAAIGTRGSPILYPGGTEYGVVFARDTDGALCVKKPTHAADGDFYIFGRIEGSPVQNHY